MMIVKLATNLALLSAVAASPTHFFVSVDNYRGRLTRNGDCTADYFFESEVLCLNDTVEKAVMKGLNEKFINEAQARTLLTYFSGLHTVHYDRRLANPKGLATFAGYLNKNNIDKIASYSDVLSEIALYITPELLVGLDNVNDIISKIHSEDLVNVLSKMAENRTSKSWLKEHGASILTQLQTNECDSISVSPTVFEIIFSNAENCDALTIPMLQKLQNSEKHFKHLNSDCLEKVKNLETLVCGVGIRNLPDAAVKKTSGFNSNCLLHMKTSQIAQLGAEEENKCRGYPLDEKVIMANGGGLRQDCFDGALSNASTGDTEGTIKIHRAWPVLPKEILAGIKDSEQFKKLGREWEYIPASHKKSLFAKTDLCESLPEGVLRFHGKVDISNECFIKLNPGNQVHAILNSCLKDDAFAMLRGENVENWKVDKATGLGILDKAFHVPNLSALINKMSTGHQELHACSSIGSFSSLKEAKALQLFADKPCFDAMENVLGGKLSLKDMKDLQPRVQKMINMNEVVKGLKESDYGELEVDTFKALQNSSNICEVMTVEQMGKLEDDCLKVLGDKCLAGITFHDKLTETLLKHVPVSSFVTLEASVISKIPSKALSAEQFGQASSSVSDPTKHHATLWDAKVVGGIDPKDIVHVHSSAWQAAPKEAYGGFTEKNFPAVPAANTVDMTYEKLAAIPAEVREKLTEEQAKEIGKNVNVTDPTKNPLLAFKDLKLPEPVQKAIDGRIGIKPDEKTPVKPADGPA